MKGLKSAVEIVSKVLEWAITLCFFVILALTIILVVLRYGFNESIIGGNELMEYLFIYTTAIGAAVALARREHIKITWFIDKLSPLYRRIVDILDFILIALINGVMIYYSIAWIHKVGSNESPVMRIPEWTFQISIPVGCGLVTFYCLVNIILTICGKWTLQKDPV